MTSCPDSPSYADERATPPPGSQSLARRILSIECGLATLVLALGIVGLVQTTMRGRLHDTAAWMLGGVHGAMITLALIGLAGIIRRPQAIHDSRTANGVNPDDLPPQP